MGSVTALHATFNNAVTTNKGFETSRNNVDVIKYLIIS
jgi:hypothetical protein